MPNSMMLPRSGAGWAEKGWSTGPGSVRQTGYRWCVRFAASGRIRDPGARRRARDMVSGPGSARPVGGADPGDCAHRQDHAPLRRDTGKPGDRTLDLPADLAPQRARRPGGPFRIGSSAAARRVFSRRLFRRGPGSRLGHGPRLSLRFPAARKLIVTTKKYRFTSGHMIWLKRREPQPAQVGPRL